MYENFKMSKEKRDEMIALIKEYFLKQREEDLGDLASALVLDFFMEELAPEFYNRGVLDSYKYMANQLEDLLGIQK